MGGRTVRVTAPGKINLFLGVGPVREDGYHDLATVFQAVSLLEEITATESEELSVKFDGPIDTAALDAQDNLVIRAAQAVEREARAKFEASGGNQGTSCGATLDVLKRVPIAGGMGGGSADAAATLVALNELWRVGLTSRELDALAVGLGADVPFALHGGTEMGLGRGDELSPILTTGHFEWVLVQSEVGLSTPEVFKELDRMRTGQTSTPVVPPELLQALRLGDTAALAVHLQNDLLPAALNLRPELGAVIELGESSGALRGLISGSGPTVIFLMPNGDAALSLVEKFVSNGKTAVRAISPVPGARVEQTEPQTG